MRFLMGLLMMLALALLFSFTARAEQPVYNAQASNGASTATYMETRLAALEEQIRAMNGAIEQAQFIARDAKNKMDRAQSDNEVRFNQIEQKLNSIEEKLTQLMAVPVTAPTAPVASSEGTAAPKPASASGTLGQIKVGEKTVPADDSKEPRAEAETAQKQPRAEAETAQKQPASSVDAQKQYEAAFNQLRGANYAEAEASFARFIKQHAGSPLSENAHYWYAETLYVRGKFGEAAAAFGDSYQKFPRGGKAPDSLLKLAMSLAALNKKPDACTVLSELKVKYPSASATVKSRAQQERQRLTCR